MKQGWEYRRFDEVFDLQMGKTPDRKNPNYFGGKNVWISIRDLGNKVISESNEHITDIAVSDTNIRKVKKGTVIMSFKLTVGKCGIAAKDLYTNEAIMAFNTKECYDIDSSFLYYYLQSYNWKGTNKAVMGLTLNKATISRQIINFPPKSTQLTIVSELDKINELIRLKKEQLKDFDDLAQSIFYEMFGDPVENEKGWEVKKLGEVCDLKAGKSIKASELSSIKSDNLYPCYGGNGIRGYIAKISHNGTYPIIGRQGALCGNVNLASGEFYATEHAVVCTPSKQFDTIYLFFALRAMKLNQYARGVAQPGLAVSNITPLSIPLPPLHLQQLFAHCIEQIEHQKTEVQKAITELETLLASRLQYWFE